MVFSVDSSFQLSFTYCILWRSTFTLDGTGRHEIKIHVKIRTDDTCLLGSERRKSLQEQRPGAVRKLIPVTAACTKRLSTFGNMNPRVCVNGLLQYPYQGLQHLSVHPCPVSTVINRGYIGQWIWARNFLLRASGGSF